jgi:hypothetical protein
MRGFVLSLTAVLGIIVLLVGVMLLFSFFTGGSRSVSILGMQGTVFAGMDSFITGIYNTMVVVSSWVQIFILFVLFVGIQGVFVYFYYRVGKILLTFRKDVEGILDELLDV